MLIYAFVNESCALFYSQFNLSLSAFLMSFNADDVGGVCVDDGEPGASIKTTFLIDLRNMAAIMEIIFYLYFLIRPKRKYASTIKNYETILWSRAS